MPSPDDIQSFQASLAQVTDHINARFSSLDDDHPIPSRPEIDAALQALPERIPSTGLGTNSTLHHLLQDITQGLLRGHAGSRFFGLVTGGVTPASQLADILGTSYDESLQINFPDATMAVAVEQKALDMVLDLLGIPVHRFQGRSVTTGATASNIMGLACARDALLLNSPHLPENYTIAENGFPPSIPSPTNPGESFIPPIKVLTVKAHGSILKAAAVTGIGRMNVHEAADASSPNLQDPWSLKFDLGKLARELETAKRIGQGVIVVVTLGEVNTGGFTPDIPVIADLCKAHGAWLHIDAAFGGFAALLPHYKYLSREMEMADSLTLDAHKWLNVPYDTAMFYTRNSASLKRSFGPSPRLGTPAYLKVHPDEVSPAMTEGKPVVVPDDILRARVWHAGLPSPLDCGIENSRRFRALPLYAGLLEQGRSGYTDIVRRNCDFAQRICGWMADPCAGGKWYTVINGQPVPADTDPAQGRALVPLNVVLFRGSNTSPFPSDDQTSTTRLLHAINRQRLIYVTPTSWAGVGALRIAVSNWRTGREGEGDYEAVVRALSQAMDPRIE